MSIKNIEAELKAREAELKAREALKRAKENPQPALSLGVSMVLV